MSAIQRTYLPVDGVLLVAGELKENLARERLLVRSVSYYRQPICTSYNDQIC